MKWWQRVSREEWILSVCIVVFGIAYIVVEVLP